MRLVQKSKEQTGIAVIQCEGSMKFIPLFSKDPLKEANNLRELNENLNLTGVYLSLRAEELIKLLKEANDFKHEYHRIPRHVMDQLRTGFAEGSGLRQVSDICLYL